MFKNKKILGLVLIGLFYSGVSIASEVTCNGKKSFYSPYPGAGGTTFIRLNIDDENGSINLKFGSRFNFSLNKLTHNKSKGIFTFNGLNNNSKIKGKIIYLSPNGVKATVKLSGEKQFTYKCTSFSVD